MDNLTLNEIEKCYIEFLYKLKFFYEDFHKRVNTHTNIRLPEGVGYIINPKLIETIKSIFCYDKMKQFFIRGSKINDIIISFPNHLIQEIKQSNHEILKNEELFNLNIQKHGKIELKYFTNCIILDSTLISCLHKDVYIYNKIQKAKISYVISNNKLILKYEFVINIGILNNYIFIPEILLLCTGKENLEYIFNSIIYKPIDNIINQTKILENNIGKYKGHNIIVFLNTNYIPKNPFIENNNVQNNHKEHLDIKNNFPNTKNDIKNMGGWMSSNKMQFQNNLKMNPSLQFNQNINSYNLTNYPQYNQANIKNGEQWNFHNSVNNFKNVNNLKDDKSIDILNKKKQIENLICMYIDLQKTNIKINQPFNNSSFEKYYIINLDWYNNYLQNKQMYHYHLFNNNMINSKINSIIYNCFKLSNIR